MSRGKKERIKSYITGLALMITIGSAGALGSYAYFTDKEQASNDLIITMGELSTMISNSINISLDINNLYKTETFKITNTGNLKQNLSIDFFGSSISENLNLELLTCSLSMSYDGKKVVPKGYSISNLKQLLDEGISELVYEGTSTSVEIEPNNTKPIVCNVTIGIKDGLSSEQLKSLEEKSIKFNTKVNSIQVGSKGGGNNEVGK